MKLRKIREGRQALDGSGHTQEEYAARLGVSQGHLSKIERGLVESMDVELAWAISRVYGVPMEMFDAGKAA